MPITYQVYQVLFGDKPPADAISDLMVRDLKPEDWS
jgi:glycerol-3-phosphate dehydrogenase